MSSMRTFRGGVHPLHEVHEGKGPTRGEAVRDYVAGTVTILMGMHLGAPSTPCVQPGDHVRLGGEGYVSTLLQKRNGSYVRMGWGGVVADFYWPIKRWSPYAGVCIGGGKTSTLLVLDGSDSDWESETNAVVHKEPFLLSDEHSRLKIPLIYKS